MQFIVSLKDLPHDIEEPLFHSIQYEQILHHKKQYHLYFSQQPLSKVSTLKTSDLNNHCRTFF